MSPKIVALVLLLGSPAIGQSVQSQATEDHYPLIAEVVPCIEKPFFCIGNEQLPEGLFVTVVDSKGQQCRTKTGKHATANFEISEGPGTQLVEAECVISNDASLAVVSPSKGCVTDFEWLKAEKVDDMKQIKPLLRKLIKSKKLSEELIQLARLDEPPVTVLKHPHPTSVFYSVDFESCPGPLFFVWGDQIVGQFEENNGEREFRYFRLNHRYYIETCYGLCESDCGIGYTDVSAIIKIVSTHQPK